MIVIVWTAGAALALESALRFATVCSRLSLTTLTFLA